MDLKEQVARRRAELIGEERAIERERTAAKTRALDRERVERSAAVQQVATDLTTSGIPARRYGETLEMETKRPPLALESMKRARIAAMINREIRHRWTPTENWVAISLISAGIPLLAFFGLGVLLIAAGLDQRTKFNRKHRKKLFDEYPQLKAALDDA